MKQLTEYHFRAFKKGIFGTRISIRSFRRMHGLNAAFGAENNASVDNLTA